MTEISVAFRELASVLEALESGTGDAELTAVAPVDEDVVEHEAVSVNAEFRIPVLKEDVMNHGTKIDAQTASLSDDGALEVELQITANPVETECASKDSEERHISAVDTADEANSGESQGGDVDIDSSPTNAQLTDNDGEVTKPAYRDPEQLEAVYETHETFQEMTDALDVDVTPQTVRRYMIKHGIHTPSSSTGQRAATTLLEIDAEEVFEGEGPHTRLRKGPDSVAAEMEKQADPTATSQHGASETSQSASSTDYESERENSSVSNPEQTPTVAESNCEDVVEAEQKQHDYSQKQGSVEGQATNGTLSANQNHSQTAEPDVDLPDHLTLAQVKATVQNAKTLYDVQQELDIERERAQTLLQELNLLDLVHGRLSTRGLQERTMKEINRRIQTDGSRVATQSSTTHG